MLRTLLTLLVIVLSPALASAHALGIDCKIVRDKVEVETYYDDDTGAAKAKVKVLNAKDEVVASGVTDDKGKWSFGTPAPGKYVIHIDAGAGHRAKKSFEVPGGEPQPKESTPTSTPENPPPTKSISEGPNREEFTRTPWLKIVIGFTIIGACSGAFVIAMKMRKK